MNTQRNTPANPPTRTPRSDAREASGQHEGLRHPVDDDQRVEQRLDDVGPDDQGEVVEDQLRDRRSSGKGPEDNASDKDVQRH